MEDNRISKKLAVFSVLLATIITGIGVAFGYFVWNSITNTDISFTVEGAVVQLDDGSDIKGANLMPVASYTSGGKNVVKKDIKIKLKDTVSDTVTVDFKLKVNSIDSGLNHSSFMYNLVNASGTSVKSGNFSTSKAGDTISLLTLSTSDGSLTTSLSSYTLYIYINGASGDNPSSMMNQSFDFSLDVTGSNSSVEYMLTTKRVESLDDGTTGDSGSGVYKVTHSAIASGNSATGSDIKATTDYRYYGANPNNYICLDMEGQSTCSDKHLYRIIGSIYEENAGTNLLKVIKATPLTDGRTSAFSWNYSSTNNYTNIWATPTNGNYSNSLSSGSTLMQLLNSGAWWNGTTGSYYDIQMGETPLNFTNYKLSDKAKSYISTSRYYLGGYNNNSPLTNEMYGYERGTLRYDTSRPLYWDGMVGLMYPSDYGYASGKLCSDSISFNSYNDSCKDRNWIFNNRDQWLITPRSDSPYLVFYLNSTGTVLTFYVPLPDGATSRRNVRPTFFLISTTTIVSGTGSIDDPYVIK